MAARLKQDRKQHTGAKPAPVGKTGHGIDKAIKRAKRRILELKAERNAFTWDAACYFGFDFRLAFEEAEARRVAPLLDGAQWDAALWDRAVESLGRSAGVLEELAESTDEAIARISARGDRIDRIQKETRALLNALVASEADA